VTLDVLLIFAVTKKASSCALEQNQFHTKQMHKVLVALALIAAYVFAAPTTVTILADDYVRFRSDTNNNLDCRSMGKRSTSYQYLREV
jgi:hypothetical protein